MKMSSTVVMVTIAVVIVLASYVGGQTSSYNTKTQLCCNGTVFNIGNSGNTACCGSTATYNPSVSQCCSPENTVIPLVSSTNSSQSLTCCAGKGEVVGYNQLCCNGVISTQPPALYTNAVFSCCNTTIITNRQSCCNGKVIDDANQLMGCCGNTFYDTSNSICCNNNIVKVPSTSYSYNYDCCGNRGYDNTLQVCDDTTGTVYTKPNDTTCQNQYNQVCNGAILSPNQVCCNGKAFYPPYVWVPNSNVQGGGSLGVQAYCCPSGNGIVQDPNKETCCNNGAVPIDFSTQQCCGNTLYDPAASTCCNTTASPGYGLSCCGSKAYEYTNQLCCNGQLLNGGPNMDCCTPNYDV